MENPIILGIQDSKLEESTALSLQEKFVPFLEQAEQRKADALAINVTDVSQKAEMQMAREMRLQIKAFRGIVESTRKELKEESLRKGQAIDKVANIIKGMIEPTEWHLEQQEKFAIIQEANRKAELKAKRMALLAPYDLTPDFMEFVKVEDMTEEMFDKFLQDTQTAHTLALAEKERFTVELEAKRQEDQKLREENARLMAENLAKDQAIAKAEQEKQAAEAKQKVDDEAKLKLQQDEAYKNFLYAHGCNETTKGQFTTKRTDDGRIILYKKVAQYKPFQDIDPVCGF